MAFISEEFLQESLKKKKIKIITKYIVGNKIIEKNSDNNNYDDIKNGIICEKDYYQNNTLVKKENLFLSNFVLSQNNFCFSFCLFLNLLIGPKITYPSKI